MIAARLLLIVAILLAGVMACTLSASTGWERTPSISSGAGNQTQATAVFGAQQFHAQLTALARPYDPSFSRADLGGPIP
jgi:hypothetical protein